MTITIATVQSHISADTRLNGRDIRRLMAEARTAGARLVHFPEGALPGYVNSEIKDWTAVDWAALRDEIEATAACASELGIWVVFGSNHPQEHPAWPNNSLHVISDQGSLVGRYDKRLISYTEATSWYAPGTTPFVFQRPGDQGRYALSLNCMAPTASLCR
jgi:predicted amidohydrolase